MVAVNIGSRSADVHHHIHLGEMWLNQAIETSNTSSISYAGFEFRLSIERITSEYWVKLLAKSEEDLNKNVHRVLSSLAKDIREHTGHQKILSKNIDFFNLIYSLLKVEAKLEVPDMPRLTKYWERCSDFCHIAWTLKSYSPDHCSKAIQDLTEMKGVLLDQADVIVRFNGLPQFHEPNFLDLRNRFVAEEISIDDVKAHLSQIGVYAVFHPSDGQEPRFVGEAIPPSLTPE